MKHYYKKDRNAKRLLVISHGIGGGGAQKVTAMLSNGFSDRGYQVRIVTTSPSESIYEIRKEIEYMPVHARQKTSFMRTLYRIQVIRKNILDFKPDYILSLSAIPNMLAIIARGCLKADLIVSERTDPSRHPSGWLAAAFRNYLYRFPKAVVFQTESAKAYFHRNIQKKGVVIPNAVLPDIPVSIEEKRRKKIAGMGALTDQKDWMTGIRAFEMTVRKHPEYQLVIYGDGPERTRIENYISRHKRLKDKVFLPGFAENVLDKISDAEIFISSSAYDGISNSILEAMAMGLPCVCTDAPAGGAGFLIDDGRNGFLVPVGDYKKMHERILRLIEDKDLAKRAGKKAMEVRKTYEYHHILDRWEKTLLKKRG